MNWAPSQHRTLSLGVERKASLWVTLKNGRQDGNINPTKGNPTDMQPSHERNDPPETDAPEDQPGEPGAEGGSHSDAKDKLPGAPADDDSPLGDTDQHSDA